MWLKGKVVKSPEIAMEIPLKSLLKIKLKSKGFDKLRWSEAVTKKPKYPVLAKKVLLSNVIFRPLIMMI